MCALLLAGASQGFGAAANPAVIDTGLGRMHYSAQLGARWAWPDNDHLLLTTATEESAAAPRTVTAFNRRSGKATQLLSPAMLDGCRQEPEPLYTVMVGNPFVAGAQVSMQLRRWAASPPRLDVDPKATQRWTRKLCRVEVGDAEFWRGNAAARDGKQQVGLLAPEHGSIGFDRWSPDAPPVKLYWYPPGRPKQVLDATAADMLERPPEGYVFRLIFLPYADAYLLSSGGFDAERPAQTVVMTLLSTQGKILRFPVPASLLALAKQDSSLIIESLPIKGGALHRVISHGEPGHTGVYIERQGRLSPRLCLPGPADKGNCQIKLDLESVAPDGCGLAFQALPAKQPHWSRWGTVHVADLCH